MNTYPFLHKYFTKLAGGKDVRIEHGPDRPDAADALVRVSVGDRTVEIVCKRVEMFNEITRAIAHCA